MKKLLLLFLIPFLSTPSLADYEVIDDFYCEMTKFVTVYANKPTANWKPERFKMEVEMDFDDNSERVRLSGGYLDRYTAKFIMSSTSDDFIAEIKAIQSIYFEDGILRVLEYVGSNETTVIFAECI